MFLIDICVYDSFIEYKIIIILDFKRKRNFTDAVFVVIDGSYPSFMASAFPVATTQLLVFCSCCRWGGVEEG